MILKSVIKQKKLLQQITREIKIQSYINHPHIVQLYGFFQTKNKIVLVIQYCQEGQLYDLLDKKKYLEQKQASQLIRDIAIGIGDLHENNIIHRDLKLENIVLCVGSAKICDFGWSVFIQNKKRQTLCGTPIYLSPEILMGCSYDNKVDVWSLGILTYELLTGQSPFVLKNKNQLQKILKGNINFPENMSQCCIDFIENLLKKNPQQRISIFNALQHNFLKRINSGISI